jgi:hypothetical protein
MTKAKARQSPVKLLKGKDPLIRDGYSMPKSDYDLIEKIRNQCWKLKPNKSEVLRAGLKALDGMSKDQLAKAMGKVVKLKPGPDPEKAQEE